MDEHAGCLCPPPLLSLALAFVEGLAKFLCLQRGHLGLLLVDLALVVELLALDVELPGLDLEQLALLLGEHLLVLCLPLERPDLMALFEERSDGEDGGNDREPREHSRGDGGYLRGHQERHGLSVRVVASFGRTLAPFTAGRMAAGETSDRCPTRRWVAAHLPGGDYLPSCYPTRVAHGTCPHRSAWPAMCRPGTVCR
jgi:hypothetical protein